MEYDVWYTGKEKPDDEEKQVRREIGLPVTKQLVYYHNAREASSKVDVLQYRVDREFNITDKWFVIELETADHQVMRIHSEYLKEMQKPSFIADMLSQQSS